jgi:hypothetical protein
MRTRIYNDKQQIYCSWRKRWVRLTPEEWVRQQLLHMLVDQLGYPAGLIAVEVQIMVGDAKRRCDAVVYDRRMQPLMLIECKAESVPLTQKTLDQAVVYNRRLNVPYLILHNGPQTIAVHIQGEQIQFGNSLPAYSSL